MNAAYISSTSFSVSGNHTTRFVVNRKVKAYCGVSDGYKYCTVESSSYSAPNTTVVVSGDALTSNLATVMLGVVSSGDSGSMPRIIKGMEVVSTLAALIAADADSNVSTTLLDASITLSNHLSLTKPIYISYIAHKAYLIYLYLFQDFYLLIFLH